MKIQLIRHATFRIEFNGIRLLVDPMLSPAGTMDPAQNAANNYRNPLVELPSQVDLEDLQQVDALLITHIHRDHFDEAAITMLPKNMLVFCQPRDKVFIESKGFNHVHAIEDFIDWKGIRLTRTTGKHGTGELAEKMGPVSGYVLSATEEPTLYIAGDTIWCQDVENALDRYHPEVTVVFAGAAQFLCGGPITMTCEDIEQVCRNSPDSQVVVAHMEAWNHCLLTRNELGDYVLEKNLTKQVRVPENGELLEFN